MFQGWPLSFLQKTGLLDSALGGTCAGQQVPGRGEPAEPAEDIPEEDAPPPFADQDAPPPPPTKKDPTTPPKANPVDLEDLLDELEKAAIVSNGEMKIKTCLLTDVRVKGAVSGLRDVLVAQARAPPGASLDTLKFRPLESDPNKVYVSCQLDEHCSIGEYRCRAKWYDLNSALAGRIAGCLHLSSQQDTIGDFNFEIDDDEFEWPENKKSELVPLDPYRLFLRRKPMSKGKSLFEFESIHTKGLSGVDTVPCWLVTAFFCNTPIFTHA